MKSEMEYFYLKDIRYESFPDKSITDWDFVQGKYGNIRIYYKPSEENGLGFKFYAIEKIGHICDEETEINEWHEDYCFVECMFYGVAYSDGIRHLYFGSEQTDNYGYYYYPNAKAIVDTMNVLFELETKYCHHVIR